jgi:hypothetical protein
MRKESRRGFRFLLPLFLATAGGPLIAQITETAPVSLPSLLPAEAPSSIFNARLGNDPGADAELTMSGSWSATTISTLELQTSPSGGSSFSSSQPLLFTQDPELALEFTMYKKIFVEARVSSDITQAYYAAGYKGAPAELVQDARIGNDGISFPSLPFLAFGEGSYRSFGAAATLKSGDFTGRAMVRYDQANWVTKHFIGGTEITETTISPNAFVSGRFFVTKSAPATGLLVFVQSVSGTLAGSDGDTYRQLGATEYSFDALTGYISLTVAATTRVLACYAGSASDVSLAGIGGCDLLYDPPPTTPTSATLDPGQEILNRYQTTASALNALAFVRNAASGLRDDSFVATIDSSGFVEVDQVDATGVANSQAYLQPFADSSHGNMAWIYTTNFSYSGTSSLTAPVYTRDLVVRTLTPSSSISIDKDFVAGSIQVTVNGIPDYAFTVDADKGILELATPPNATDDIVVSYLEPSAERTAGNIAGALGGFWDFEGGEEAWAALGASWAIPGASFDAGSQTNPGNIDLTLGESKSASDFTHDFAIAGRYSQGDASGMYRIEGMEGVSSYASAFMPTGGAATYTDIEVAESGLSSSFPSLVSSLHSDGSTQKALQITAPASPSASASFYTVESAPPYDSFKSFSFFAKMPSDAALTVTLDDGTSSPTTSVSVTLLAGAGDGTWKRYLLHYGNGDATVYAQSSESDSERAVVGASSVSPQVTSTGSRLVVTVKGLQAGESAWVDEVLLEDSLGSAALLFQGQAAYKPKDLGLGSKSFPILSVLSVSGDAEGALDSTPYASAAADLGTTLLFARLDLRARVSDSSSSGLGFSGGHTIELPTSSFPVKVKDSFDLDPVSGAFGRADSLTASAGPIAALSLDQSSAWTPADSSLDQGMLNQTWGGTLTLGPSIATFGLTASNRSMPSGLALPGGEGAGYAAAWIGAFEYALPEYEADAVSRQSQATVSVKDSLSREYLSASMGETTSPSSYGTGTRQDTASARLALPLSFGKLQIEPYYSRAWTDSRSDYYDGLLSDAAAALGDFEATPVLYESVPFKELFSGSTASDFASQTLVSGNPLLQASLAPAVGLDMSRDFGSKWYDLVAPSAASISYGRALARASDQVTDSSLWSAQAKCSAVNLFGSLGAYPLGLPFDSDEYMSTLQGSLSLPSGGGESSLSLQYHGLATVYRGPTDRMDLQGDFNYAKAPSSLSWTGELTADLARAAARHWLLDLYALAAGPASARKAAPGARDSSIASAYIEDLATRKAGVTTTWTLKMGLAGMSSDAASYAPGWSLGEAYDAKLSVPNRITLDVKLSSDQVLDASTQVFTFDLGLSLGLVLSF